MPINWSAEMDRKLLLAILKIHDVQIDKAKVAEELSTEDQPCTTMAIQKRLQAIKGMIKEGSTDENTPKPRATPRKRGAAASKDEPPTKKAKVSKGKGSKAKSAEESDGEGACKGLGAVKQDEWDEDELAL